MFVIEGIQEHFNILKIHAMSHYYAAIQSCGSLDGFNTESPEQLHIDYAKEAYCASNKKEYVGQMMVWLGRQKAVARFRAYLDYVRTLDPITLDPTPPDNKTNDNKENEDLDPEDTDQSRSEERRVGKECLE